MARQLSEKQVLKKLDIPDFRHLTKEKAIEMVSMIPHMDKEVAMKALEQYPELVKSSLDMVNTYKEAATKALDSNDESVKARYDALSAMQSLLEVELQRENMTEDERMFVLEQIAKIPELAKEVDRDNKVFLLKVVGVMSTVVAGVVGVTAAALGGNFSLGSGEK